MKENNLNTTRQKRRIPRILSLVLAIVMVITSVPQAVFAGEVDSEIILVQEAEAQGAAVDEMPGTGIAADVIGDPEEIVIDETVYEPEAGADSGALADDEVLLGDVEEIVDLSEESGEITAEEPESSMEMEPETGAEVSAEEGMFLDEMETGEEDIVELGDDEYGIMPVSMTDGQDLKLELYFADADTGEEITDENLQFTEIYEGNGGTWNTCTKRIIAEKSETLGYDFSHINLTYSFENEVDKRYLYIIAPIDNCEIKSWDIEMSDEEILGEELTSQTVAYKKTATKTIDVGSGYKFSFQGKTVNVDGKDMSVIRIKPYDSSKLGIPGLKIIYKVKQGEPPVVLQAQPADQASIKIPEGKLELTLKSGTDKGQEYSGAEQEDKSIQLSQRLSELPENSAADPYTITVTQTGLVNGENKYRVSDWLIGKDKPDTSINAINVNEKTNPFENYGYEISEDGNKLTITVPDKNSLKSFTVKPVLKSIGGYKIKIKTEPVAAGIEFEKYTVNNKNPIELKGSEEVVNYSEEDISAGSVSWELYLKNTYFKEAYENLRCILMDGEETVKTAIMGDAGQKWNDGWASGNNATLGFSDVLKILVWGIKEEKYELGNINLKIMADKRDVPMSLEQDRGAAASFSYTLKQGERVVESNENLSLSNLEPQTFFTLLAKDGAAAGEKQALLDKEADYQLEIKLNNWDQNYDFKNWTVNDKGIGDLGYPEQFQTQTSDDGKTLTISAPGAYLPVLKIGTAFESALQMELKVRKPENNDKLNYSLYLEDTTAGEKRTLLNGGQEGSGYIERSFIEAGHSYILRAEALRTDKEAGNRPDDDIYGSNYLCGWDVDDRLEALCEQNKANGWEIRPLLSEGYSYGYETLEVAFTGALFLSYMEKLKTEGREEEAVWEFQVLTDQVKDDSSATYKATADVSDSTLGEAKAEFVENTVLDGNVAASIWNLKAKPASNKKALQYWSKKQNGTDSYEKVEDSEWCYRCQVIITENQEYQAVFGEPPIAFAGEYMGTFPVDSAYQGYSDSEWRKLSACENGKYLNNTPLEAKYQVEKSVQMTAYKPAALLFHMDLPILKEYDMTFKLYKGEDTEPFKECTIYGIEYAGNWRIMIGVDSLPDTDRITIEAETSDGRMARKTYPLYLTPITNDAEKGNYIQQLRTVYDGGINKIKDKHGENSYKYSSAYVMLRYEYQKAAAEIASLEKEEARARFEKEKTILESIGNEIIPEDVGIRVSGWNQVVAIPEGATIETAMCALLEKAGPGEWIFEVYSNQFGSWVNQVAVSGGTGAQTYADKQKGRWQYRIRGYNKDKKIYQEYAPLGVSSQIMLDGDFVTAGVGEEEWMLQCLGICRGAEAEKKAREEGLAAVAGEYNVDMEKLRHAPFPKKISDWIDAVNEIVPVTLGSSFGYNYQKDLIKNTADVAAKISKADKLMPTGIYLRRMENSEWLKAFSDMKTRFKALSAGGIEGVDKEPDDNQTGVQNYLVETVAEDETFGYGNEWDVFALAQSGKLKKDDEAAQKYKKDLDAKLEAGIFDSLGDVAEGEELGGYTEYERIVLALTSLEKDASSYTAENGKTYDFIEKILDYEKVTAQGLNAVDYALLALDAGGYDSGNQEIRRRYIEYILDRQLDDGGWNLTGLGSAETDMTAMTLQALAPYRKDQDTAVSAGMENDVEKAIGRGLAALQGMQSDLYGDFGYEGSYNAESTAQVLVALCALGIDGGEAEGWKTQYGGSVVAGLLHYYQEIEGREGMGAFLHAEGGSIDAMATQQAAYALEAYRRFKTEGREKRLYDMTDKVNSQSAHSYDVSVSPASGGKVTADPASGVLPGAYVTVTVSAETNYALASLKMNGKEIGPEKETGAYRFLMPPAAATVEAEFTKEAEHVHTYDEGKVTKKAECEKPGEMTYTCTGCGETRTEEIPAAGHDFGEWETTKEPTEEETGIQERKCKNCDKTESRTIPSTAHEHSYDEGKVTKEAGCETPGEMTYTCTECGETKTEEIPAVGHRFGKWITTKSPTAAEDGMQIRICENCGKEESQVIPKTGGETPYIVLNVSELTLQAGQSTAAVRVLKMAAGDSVKSWKSSSTKIVTVDQNGNVKAKNKAGTATITVTTVNGAKAAIKVTVRKEAPYVTLNVSSLVLQTGQSTKQLKVTGMLSGDSVKSWKSSNKKIVVVGPNGGIKAQNKVGTATITVTTTEGAKASVKVTVRKAKVTATKITGLKKKVTLKKGKTLKLNPELSPITAQDEITYKSSDSGVVKVNKNGKLTARKKGTATITVKAGKAKATVKVTVTK